MSSKSSISSASRILLLGAVFLFVFGALSPQQAVARLELERAMPVGEGDPGNGWDNNGGGGGGEIILPLDDGKGFFAPQRPYLFSSLYHFVGNSMIWVIINPNFVEQSLLRETPLSISAPEVLGGVN